MDDPNQEEPRRSVESIGLEGLELANQGDFGERFGQVLDALGVGSPGIWPTPEGLVLQALYHQSRGSAHPRTMTALEEVKALYDQDEEAPNLSPEVSPMVISGLAIALDRSRHEQEQYVIAAVLESAADRLRRYGYKKADLQSAGY